MTDNSNNNGCSSLDETINSTSIPKAFAFALKKSPAKIQVAKKVKVFDEEEEEPAPKKAKMEDSLNEMRATLDKDEAEFIDKFAEFACKHGDTFVAMTKEKNAKNERFRFLFVEALPSHQYYKAKLRDLQNNIVASESVTTNVSITPSSPGSSSTPSDPFISRSLISQTDPGLTSGSTEESSKRKRSRWGEKSSPENQIPASNLPLQQPGISQSPPPAPSNLAYYEASSSGYISSRQRSYSRYSDIQKAGMVRVGGKWAYPEDEITDASGTWEHKRRLEEMRKTETKAKELTGQAETKRAHHLAHYLPKSELEKLEAKVKAVKQGIAPPVIEDHSENKLDVRNKGFEMLVKQGWKEGTGLGKDGTGVTAPINRASQMIAQAGLGQEKPEDISADDDEFELYRKRMMTAYKYRPNPLNNPRRPYY